MLTLLATANTPITVPQIIHELRLSRKERKAVFKTLDQLTAQGRLNKKGKKYTLYTQTKTIQATLDLTAKGFAFATPVHAEDKEKDIFIARENLATASHQDLVQVELLGHSRGRRVGRVVQVEQRAVIQLCGIYYRSGPHGYVHPDNEKLPYTVRVARDDSLGAEDGMAVLVRILEYGNQRSGPKGEILAILGDPFDPAVQIQMAIRQFSLRDTFPVDVLKEAEELLPITACEKQRVDLSGLLHVTIDGSDSRDFDDAICVTQDKKGYTLYVSIADVTHYVRPGSALDKEALKRGTSTYLPDRVLPMLPERLSNNLCSLVPHEPRPAFTAILSFDLQGRRTGEKYCKSLIESKRRLTYETVNRILYEPDTRLIEQCKEFLPMLSQAKELVALLRKQRLARGSLDFNLPEAKTSIAGNQVVSITLAARNRAHQLIEECMLAANEAVAETLVRAGRQALFRIHEDPDAVKLENFREVCKLLGIELPQTEVSPAWFAEVLRQARHEPREYVINNLLLRTMQQARYAPCNTGHFGLAAPYYLHFTSPIRRYPDIIAHRALHALLLAESAPKLLADKGQGPTFEESGPLLSRCERTAIDTERSVAARMAVLYLRGKIGETFAAVISGVTSFGLFVELKKCFISGTISVKDMRDDHYLHDERRHRLIGERTNTMYQLGDEVTVILNRVDILSKRIHFTLADCTPLAGP
ncbi:MAG: ribonuclease R [Desulfobulbus propionicus]|nr:MAG: ribonuclease R [Desulfobulbus propionicus]